jgi:hypothetical protein
MGTLTGRFQKRTIVAAKIIAQASVAATKTSKPVLVKTPVPVPLVPPEFAPVVVPVVVAVVVLALEAALVS